MKIIFEFILPILPINAKTLCLCASVVKTVFVCFSLG